MILLASAVLLIAICTCLVLLALTGRDRD